jgi:outer membrane lipoprotein-sorting protein
MMKRILNLSIALLILFSIVAPCRSQESSHEMLDLDAILSTASETKSFSCDFVQEKRLTMLKKPAVAKGRLYYLHPDRLRWDQTEPILAGFVVIGKKLKRWEGKESNAETTDLAKDIGLNSFVSQVFAWHDGDEEWLRKRYEIGVIEETPPTVRLVPLEKMEKRFISHLNIIFSEDLTLVRKVEVETKKKDTITTTFVNCIIDPPLPKGLFRD